MTISSPHSCPTSPKKSEQVRSEVVCGDASDGTRHAAADTRHAALEDMFDRAGKRGNFGWVSGGDMSRFKSADELRKKLKLEPRRPA